MLRRASWLAEAALLPWEPMFRGRAWVAANELNAAPTPIGNASDLVAIWEPVKDIDPTEIVLLRLIRHVESRSNQARAFQGAQLPGSEPTSLGRKQAIKRARRELHRIPACEVAAVFSSPALRATGTAEPLAKAFGVDELILLPELLEVALPPSWHARSKAEIKRSEADYRAWLSNPYLNTPLGGESADRVLARAEHSLRAMASYTREQGKHISYGVSHKGLLRYVLARYLGALDPEGVARAVKAGVDKHPHWNIRIRNAEPICVFVYRNRVVLPDRGDRRGPAYPLHYRKLAQAACRN